jgi:hypothetical protein
VVITALGSSMHNFMLVFLLLILIFLFIFVFFVLAVVVVFFVFVLLFLEESPLIEPIIPLLREQLPITS